MKAAFLLAAAGLLAWGPAAVLCAQDKEIELPPEEDPYTEGDREAWKNAGYERFGSFPFVDRHRTVKIDEVLGEAGSLWLETKHFRIGSTLADYKIPTGDRKQRTKIEEELERLAEIIPNVKPKTKKLDRWLRLHLWAMRLEELYDDVSEILAVTDASFPKGPGELVDGEYRGEGPYLGMKDKYTVILFEKESGLGRFALRFAGRQERQPFRHGFSSGSLFFGACTETAKSFWADDTKMHTLVVFNVAHNLLDGYQGYYWSLPVWLPEGISHILSRRIDERFNNYSYVEEASTELRKEWDWAPKVRKRVKNKIVPSAETVMNWTAYDKLKFVNHLSVWSRVDFLLETRAIEFAAFMSRSKTNFSDLRRGEKPSTELILARQSKLFQEIFGWDGAAFDEAWENHVLKTYSKR